WAEKRIGRERCRTTYAFRSLLDSGATVVFGSDWDVAPISPLSGIDAAVNRRTLDGRHPDGWIPEQKIPVIEALRSCSTRGVFVAVAERGKGSHAVRRLAGIVVLSRDPLSLPAGQLDPIEVAATVVGGRLLYPRSSA